MSGGYRVVVTGDEQVRAQFKALGFKVSDLSAAFGQIAAEVAGDARATAPKVSGRLAGNVRPGRAKTKATVAVGGAGVPYAGPINYGWRARNIAPTRFMNKAADDKADSSAVTLAREIQRLIRSVGLD